ncbi:hypothetical protein, partial [Dyella japonica]|uniref:hypothetical protein n=1 Tax=Dyella japonica TaxID=231455 RepID=UPI001ED90BD2
MAKKPAEAGFFVFGKSGLAEAGFFVLWEKRAGGSRLFFVFGKKGPTEAGFLFGPLGPFWRYGDLAACAAGIPTSCRRREASPVGRPGHFSLLAHACAGAHANGEAGPKGGGQDARSKDPTGTS